MHMGKTESRAEREMQALVRKTRRQVLRQRQIPDEQGLAEQDGKRAVRYVDTTSVHDVRVEDATADEIFQEMKRRSF
jgi:hypothetical protein